MTRVQKWIMKHYCLPFLRKGLTVKCGETIGTIIGFKNNYLIVKLTNGVELYHPTWNMVYLEGSEILRDFTSN